MDGGVRTKFSVQLWSQAEQLEILSSTGGDIGDIRDEQLKIKLEKCLNEKICDELKGIVMDQGSEYMKY